ncbi:glucose-6-phosphate dehydrogenase [Verrucomicrobiota bacterium]
MEQAHGFAESGAAQPVSIVIMGASGDLTKRKIVPALYSLYIRDLLPERFSIIGFARRDYTSPAFQEMMQEALQEFAAEYDASSAAAFVEHITYFRGNLDSPDSYRELKQVLGGHPENLLFYLSTNPDFFEVVVNELAAQELIRQKDGEYWSRVVVEKPFGHDLASAKELNEKLLARLDESQIYRIDHYLGKETVQNVLAFRFANSIFEPLFNRTHVDHIQITSAESIGMEGARGGYYDEYGALRDMMANHLLQLLSLVLMEAPSDLTAESIHDEKVKVLKSIHADVQSACMAQYAGDEGIKSFREEDRVDPDSRTDTYAAVRMSVGNWRWADVPVFIRTGKRMAKRATEVVVQFKEPTMKLFQTVDCEGDVCDISAVKPNQLIFRIQPDEGIFLRMSMKRPAMRFVVESAEMDFSYSGRWGRNLPDAYERLILDALNGDSTLFARSDEVEAAWAVVDPVLQNRDELPLHEYVPGSWGPLAASDLFEGVPNRKWKNP